MGTPTEAIELECDVVMAGGITSGIVYPGALAMIAQRYRFRGIGGTSVGAIAAAITAAAEYGRRIERNPGSFVLVAKVASSLAERGADGRSRLFHLFTPEPGTAPLMRILAPGLVGGTGTVKARGMVGRLLSAPRIGGPAALLACVGALPALTLIGEEHWSAGVVAVFAGLALAAAGGVAATILALSRRWLPAWRDNNYGLCTGAASPRAAGPTDKRFLGLTPWMHDLVQKAAGLPPEEPLTFGKLWEADLAEHTSAADPSASRSIDLAMIVSDISRYRSAQLPFLESTSPLYVETAVLQAYFPAEIASWMVQHAGAYDPKTERRDDVMRLPMPCHLPIVFGARLSLSFPGLLSAVPLLAPDFAAAQKGEPVPLRTVWFSDGGLTSNFPIHFFDSPIPSRPTFCLNLIDIEEGAPVPAPLPEETGSADAHAKPVFRPNDPERAAAKRSATVLAGRPAPRDEVWNYITMSHGNQYLPPPFTAFSRRGHSASSPGVLAFLTALLGTARGWSDNQLLSAPGVRDRVVNVALRDDEGGLNLDMDANVIADLDLRGRAAGLLISARFDPSCWVDPETGQANANAFPNHRWVRTRNTLGALEDILRRFATARRAADLAAQTRGEPPLDDMIDGKADAIIGYHVPPPARPFYKEAIAKLIALAQDLARCTSRNPSDTFDRIDPGAGTSSGSTPPVGQAPRPKMRYQLRPVPTNDPRLITAELPDPKPPTD